MKQYTVLLLSLFLCPVLSISAQTKVEPYAGTAQIVMTTTRTEGETLTLYIESPAEAQNVWLDLNDNGSCDDGEQYEYTQYKYQTFSISSSQRITIHGEVTYLDVSKCGLSKLELTAASKGLHSLYARENQISELSVGLLDNLSKLSLDYNKLTSLDVSACEKLFMLSVSDNELESLTLPNSPESLITRVYIYNNRLSIDATHTLIERLPQRQVIDKARIFLLDTTSPTEQNECNPIDVSLATLRAWSIYDWQGGENEGRNPYGGSNVGTLPIYGSDSTPHMQVVITRACVELSAVTPHTPVVLLSMTGATLAIVESDAHGCAEIDTSLLPQGIYLLRSAHDTQRIIL